MEVIVQQFIVQILDSEIEAICQKQFSVQYFFGIVLKSKVKGNIVFVNVELVVKEEEGFLNRGVFRSFICVTIDDVLDVLIVVEDVFCDIFYRVGKDSLLF